MNIALLFCVSIEPFFFNLIRNTPNVIDPGAFADATSTLYALDLAAMFAILGGFALTLADEERNLIPKNLTRQYKFEGISWFASGLIFALSALPVFFSIKLGTGLTMRYLLWGVPLLLTWVSRNVGGSCNTAARPSTLTSGHAGS